MKDLLLRPTVPENSNADVCETITITLISSTVGRKHISSALKNIFCDQVCNCRKAIEQRRNAYEILQPQIRRSQERKGRRMEEVK
jgi:hypothetical protein